MSGGILRADGVWGTGANWLDSAGASAIPILADDAIMPDLLTANVTDAGGDANGIYLAILKTHPDYAYNFGTSTSPIETAAALVQHFGSGGFYFECHNNGAAVITDRIEIAAANPNVPVEIGSAAGANAGDVVDIVCQRGNIILKGNLKLDGASTVDVGGLTSARDVTLLIDAGAEPIITFNQRDGTVVAHNSITTANINGGEFTKDTVHANAINIRGGIVYLDDDAQQADATVIHVYGGILDVSRVAYYKVVAAVYLYSGGTIVGYDEDRHTFTIFKNYGGTLRAA